MFEDTCIIFCSLVLELAMILILFCIFFFCAFFMCPISGMQVVLHIVLFIR